MGKSITTPTNFAFLHGGGQGSWVWNELLAALSAQGGQGLHAVAFDLPGCGGKRDQDTSQLSVRDVATAFVNDLANSGMDDIVLVGHSNAGTIFPIVAEMRPDLIRRYVYVTCMTLPPGQTVKELFATKRSNGVPDDTLSGGHLREMFCNDMTPDEATEFTAKLGFDSWPTLAALDERNWRYDHLRDKHATYVICLKDQALSVEWQETFAARVYAQHRVFIDAGHQVMNTRPHGLAEILLAAAATQS